MFNSKNIKTKPNKKLKAKFGNLFQVLHLVTKQVQKLELPKLLRIHNDFHILLLVKISIKKRHVDKRIT